jgi:tetratricopeptide (TPR) repeat protein
VDIASNDNFGLKVKLPNGNVTSRVLPVRIHELDQSDIKLCESLLGGILRGIEFIYRSAGVNRPLRSKEEKAHENLNNTLYRDQINKVANSIKDIIQGLTLEQENNIKNKTQDHVSYSILNYKTGKLKWNPLKKVKSRIIYLIIFGSFIIIPGFIIYLKIFNINAFEKMSPSTEKISVGVMPFRNITNDTTKNIWQYLIQYNISSNLSGTEYLGIRQVEFINNLIKTKDHTSLTTSDANTIAKILEIDVFIEGSFGQTGSIFRLDAQVIDTKTGTVLKPFRIDTHIMKEVDLNIIDSLSKMIRDFIVVSELQKETSPTNLVYGASTNSYEAFRLYILGKNAFEKKDYPLARKYLSDALSADPNYFYASVLIIYSYANTNFFIQAKELTRDLYSRRNLLPLDQQIYLDYLYAHYFETPAEAIKLLKQLVDIDNQVPNYYYLLGINYSSIFQYDKAISGFEEALKIYDRWGSKPWWIENYTKLCDVLLKTGQLKKTKKILSKAETDFPDDPDLIYYQIVLALSSGKKKAADNYLEKYQKVMKENSSREETISNSIAKMYYDAKNNDKAEEFFRRSLSLDPECLEYVFDLSRFLIETGRNINEGIELINEALVSDPENYNYLDCKGWGLYRQGKFKEATEYLQKSWHIRMQIGIYDYNAWLHLETVKKAVSG